MKREEIVDAIVESNMHTNAKILILGEISTEYRNWVARRLYEQMLSQLVLNELANTEPKRVKEIALALGDDYSVQRLTQIMTKLLLCGKVKREYVPTGRTLVVKVWGEGDMFAPTHTKEIEEIIALYSLA
jgi:hypothetical protein